MFKRLECLLDSDNDAKYASQPGVNYKVLARSFQPAHSLFARRFSVHLCRSLPADASDGTPRLAIDRALCQCGRVVGYP